MTKPNCAEIEVRNLNFRYLSGEYILSDLSFSVKKGDMVGIIGPNGSGKSTLLKCLVRFLPPESGQIYIESKELSSFSLKEIAKKIGVVPQKYDVGFDFTAEDVVMMGRFPHLRRFHHESQKDRDIVTDAMKLTNTLHLAARPVIEMSGGELQRIIIAQALAQTPEVLLLDEPTTHLDINHQIEICGLLKKLNHDKKMTIVVVLHDLNLAALYCNKLILLHKGKVFAAGDTEEVLTEDNLEKVYNTKVILRKDPVNGRISVNFYPEINKKWKPPSNGVKIHIIGGGGAAAELFNPLLSMGFLLTTGVLNIKDSDWQKAVELKIPLVEEMPFNPITGESHKDNLALIKKADIVVLCDIPFGAGNLKNLMAAKEALNMGKTLIICALTPIGRRDYTGGEATEIYNTLLSGGAVTVTETRELFEILSNLREKMA